MNKLDLEILNILRLNPELSDFTIEKTTDFRHDLGIDSLLIAEISIEIEDKYNIRFNETNMNKINTPLDLIQAVKSTLDTDQ